MRAVLHRWLAAGGTREVLRVGPVELDTLLRHVHLCGAEVQLPPKEISLLARLMCTAGRIVPRGELMLDVWGQRRSAGSRTLDVHVGSLRHRLGDDPARPRFVHTVRGVGFRFSSSAELEAATTLRTTRIDAREGDDEGHRQLRRRRGVLA